MRLEELTVVKMQPVSEDQVQVIESKMDLNLDAVVALIPATIPGQLAGPTGQPIATQACAVLFGGGMQLVVKKTRAEMRALVKGIKLMEDDDV